MSTASIPFKAVLADSLKDLLRAQAYLDVALEEYEQEGDLPFFLQALRNVAEAQGGLSQLAEKTALNRQNLYKALAAEGNPKIQTVAAMLRGMGLRLSVQAIRS
jgi:probable addiction module antidote protein